MQEARERGVSRSRTRASDLTVPFRGIRMPPADDTRAICAAYARTMPPTQAFSHSTSAELLGLPLPLWLRRQPGIHVSARAPAREPRVIGVTGHLVEGASLDFVTIDGLRVTHPLETWRTLSTVLSVDELIIMGDALVRRKNPFATLEQLHDAVAAHRGRRGYRKLIVAAGFVRARTDSPPETSIRLCIVRAGLPEPEVNLDVFNRFGVRIAIGDLGYRKYRVLIEYDGEYHFADNVQMFKDVDRIDGVMEEGWRVIRLNKTHLRRPEIVVSKVEAALRAGGWRP